MESRELFKFLREADEVAEWIQDQTALAASEDYGSDVEHVEQLIKKFDAFIASLNAAETRVQSCVARGQSLIEANHPEKDRIKEKLKETKALWDDIKELAHARQEVGSYYFGTNAEKLFPAGEKGSYDILLVNLVYVCKCTCRLSGSK